MSVLRGQWAYLAEKCPAAQRAAVVLPQEFRAGGGRQQHCAIGQN